MLCNSVGFNWLACLAATKLKMGLGRRKDEGFRARGFQRGVVGSSRVAGISPVGTTIVGGKKEKLNQRKPRPVHPIRRSDHRFSRSNSSPITLRFN
ncbi:hypothetical protein PVL29_008077 [Vitis rotundifolia]|uniref:Uncharacterized protein n=1 Tax=Vitis rotundifolia TaxID=103349 RepID=A0AA39A1M9_VITRO|nr:hypothetical protein PVL29_008077 [Vitis rotundifolia]